MEKLSSIDTLIYMLEMLELSLTELQECEEETEFIEGERTAYVECLEWLQSWCGAENAGLDYRVEDRFPLTK